jgi:alkylation response protein AidB-like acyl-CoA dehydrogenase
MGIETPADLSGSECSFTSAVIAVEELAKVDASVAVLCDVHNTLVNSVIRMYASDAIKEKWLPGLATDTVGVYVKRS